MMILDDFENNMKIFIYIKFIYIISIMNMFSMSFLLYN